MLSEAIHHVIGIMKNSFKCYVLRFKKTQPDNSQYPINGGDQNIAFYFYLKRKT